MWVDTGGRRNLLRRYVGIDNNDAKFCGTVEILLNLQAWP